MASSTVITQKKKRGPPATGKGLLLGVRLQPPEVARIDTWIAGQPEPRPTRPEAIRRLVEKGLTGDPVVAHLPDAALDRQIAKAEAAIAEMPEHAEPSPVAGLAAMDKALAENELVKLKNKRTRRKNTSRK